MIYCRSQLDPKDIAYECRLKDIKQIVETYMENNSTLSDQEELKGFVAQLHDTLLAKYNRLK